MTLQRLLFILWTFFALASVVLTVACAVFIQDRAFTETARDSIFRGTSDPNYKLIFLLALIINVLLFLGSRLGPNSPQLSRLNVPNKSYWLASSERRILFISRLRQLIGAVAAWIDFLIASTLYMTLQYFYRALPCPRHILMILIWLILTIVVGIFGLTRFRRISDEK